MQTNSYCVDQHVAGMRAVADKETENARIIGQNEPLSIRLAAAPNRMRYDYR